jgi:hypothetical protein
MRKYGMLVVAAILMATTPTLSFADEQSDARNALDQEENDYFAIDGTLSGLNYQMGSAKSLNTLYQGRWVNLVNLVNQSEQDGFDALVESFNEHYSACSGRSSDAAASLSNVFTFLVYAEDDYTNGNYVQCYNRVTKNPYLLVEAKTASDTSAAFADMEDEIFFMDSYNELLDGYLYLLELKYS